MVIGLKIDLEKKEDKRVLRLEGRLDAVTSPALERQISTLLEEQQQKLLIDFAKVDYLSSAGMRLLLASTKKLKARGGTCVLCNVNEEVMEIIKMAGFERILHLFPNEQAAWAALQ
jgi:anti-sigma B factor antagonist/stage II sporulation protein AA (anti-sigma F factor antagonist)